MVVSGDALLSLDALVAAAMVVAVVVTIAAALSDGVLMAVASGWGIAVLGESDGTAAGVIGDLGVAHIAKVPQQPQSALAFLLLVIDSPYWPCSLLPHWW